MFLRLIETYFLFFFFLQFVYVHICIVLFNEAGMLWIELLDCGWRNRQKKTRQKGKEIILCTTSNVWCVGGYPWLSLKKWRIANQSSCPGYFLGGIINVCTCWERRRKRWERYIQLWVKQTGGQKCWREKRICLFSWVSAHCKRLTAGISSVSFLFLLSGGEDDSDPPWVRFPFQWTCCAPYQIFWTTHCLLFWGRSLEELVCAGKHCYRHNGWGWSRQWRKRSSVGDLGKAMTRIAGGSGTGTKLEMFSKAAGSAVAIEDPARDWGRVETFLPWFQPCPHAKAPTSSHSRMSDCRLVCPCTVWAMLSIFIVYLLIQSRLLPFLSVPQQSHIALFHSCCFILL